MPIVVGFLSVDVVFDEGTHSGELLTLSITFYLCDRTSSSNLPSCIFLFGLLDVVVDGG